MSSTGREAPPTGGPGGAASRRPVEPAWLDRLGVRHAALRRLGGYWEALRGDRPLPQREELEPWAIPDLLPYLWLWRVDQESRRFFLRLSGERIGRLVGYWRRGSELDEVAPAPASSVIRERYEQVAFGPAVLRSSGSVLLGSEHGVRVSAERLILPLGTGRGPADDILGITWYQELSDADVPSNPPAIEEARLELDALSG